MPCRIAAAATWTRALARSAAVPLLVAVVLGGHTVPAGGEVLPSPGPDVVAANVRTTEALIAALEHEDLAAVLVRLAEEVEVVLPLAPDGNNDAAHVDRFAGRHSVRGMLWRTFLAYRRIAFVDA